ncbi:MAG: hypothetical protein AAF479_10735 [Pseudomonadota bacterium]
MILRLIIRRIVRILRLLFFSDLGRSQLHDILSIGQRVAHKFVGFNRVAWIALEHELQGV